VEYPTGGATELDFEKHTFLNGTAEFDVEDVLLLSTINDGTATSSPFTLGGPNIFIDITFSDFREPFNYPRPVVFLEELVGGNWTNVQGQTCIWQIPYPALDNVVIHQSRGLEENHTYRLRIATEGCPLPPCNTPPANAYTTNGKLTYFDNSHQYVSSGGGLRIKEIRDYTVAGGAPTNIRTYEYDSGLLVSIPVFKHQFYKRICDVIMHGGVYEGQCATMSLINCYNASSQSLANLGTSQGSHVVYKKVREKYGATGENGYTDSWFDLTGLSFNGNFMVPVKPFKPNENVDYRQGKLLRQVKYNASGEKLEYIKNTYKSVDVSSPNYHAIQSVRMMQNVHLSSTDQSSYLDGIGMYIMDGYFVTSRFVYQDSTIRTSYHKNGGVWNPITSVSRLYYENPTHIQLTRNTTTDSEGNTLETKYWYPQDYGSTETLPTMVTKNMVAVPVKEETTRNSQIISGKVTRFNGDGKPLEIHQYEAVTPQTPPTHNPSSLIPAGYVKKADIGYDLTTKKINKVQLANNVNTAYLWGYNTSLPIAEVKNAAATDVAATSFEADGKGNWSYSGPTYSDITAKTGKYYYRLVGGSITRSIPAGKYKLEYWGKYTINLSGGNITTIRTSAPDASGWIFHEKEVEVSSTTTLTISGGSTAYIDELRIYPLTAQVTTYTFDVANGITSVTDPNNVITYFEYDGFGRLRLAKDQFGNIVKAYEYHYKGL
jgi:YD repeat-containing protein